jgi:hypothetical protein
MSDEKNDGVDPRFDPAFQRGFDPSIPIEEYVPDPQPRTVAAPTVIAAPVIAAPVAAATQPPLPKPEPAAVPAPQAVVGAVDDVDDEPAVAIDADASPARNPFLLFLGIIAIALVAAGIWLFIRSGDAFNSKEVRSQGDYMSLDASIHSAPFIALLGGATAIGVLFFFASKWRRRR